MGTKPTGRNIHAVSLQKMPSFFSAFLLYENGRFKRARARFKKLVVLGGQRPLGMLPGVLIS